MRGILQDIWKVCPWYIKWMMGVIVIPNLIINTFIFFVYILPWHTTSLNAHTNPIREVIDAKLNGMIGQQTFQNKIILERMERFDQHQSLMYQTILQKVP